MRLFSVLSYTITLIAGSGFAQSASTKVARVEFIKVNPGKLSDYMKLEQMWKSVHQERVDKGQIESWALYAVLFPGGEKAEYDAVTMHAFPSFDKMETMYDAGQIAKIRTFPLATDSRQIVRYEIWSLDHIAGNPLAGKFMDVRFHKAKPEGGSAYITAVRELWLLLNNDVIKRGIRNGWSFYSVYYPGGSRRSYDWVTFDALPNFPAIGADTFAGVDQKKVTEALRVSAKARDTVINECWRQIDVTTSKKQVASIPVCVNELATLTAF